MRPISYARHQFPAEIIRYAVWLYLRFTLSYRDVEELLAERGIEASYETVRRWVLKFGPAFAHNLRRLRPRQTDRWRPPKNPFRPQPRFNLCNRLEHTEIADGEAFGGLQVALGRDGGLEPGPADVPVASRRQRG